ncbi:bifunctional folylpolyglutamate synthase/dihydrofolate synthase, partial [Streptococcus suis]
LLGSTFRDISEQKGGIIKESFPVVIVQLSPESTAMCRQISQDNQAPVYHLGQAYTYKEGQFSKPDIDL